jgi:GntR family transcriptional regulator
MMLRPNPSSGVPIYLQIMEQVKHGVETGALRPGEQLPGIRSLAEELVINPNTVAKAYRELEHEGIVELRQGAGAFIAATAGARKLTDKLRAGQTIVAAAMEKLRARGMTDEEIRRLFEAELSGLREAARAKPGVRLKPDTTTDTTKRGASGG